MGANAHVEYVTVQNRHPDAALRPPPGRGRARREAASGPPSALGARTGKTRMESRLAGPGSTVRADRHVHRGRRPPPRPRHDAGARRAARDQRPRLQGRAADESRAVWRGVIRVAPGAQRTDAYQENRNLLLSPRAHADSIPGLEIDTNDVRCTHGATAGPVDRELLFYLMSRGIERKVASASWSRASSPRPRAHRGRRAARAHSKSLEARIR